MAVFSYTGSDSYTLTDSIVDTRDFVGAYTDTLSLSDAAAFSAPITVTLADTLTLFTDTVKTKNVLVDFLNLKDSIAIGFGYPFRSKLDSIVFSDSTLALLTGTIAKSDTISLSDLFAANAPPQLSTDVVSLSDAVVTNLLSIFTNIGSFVSDTIAVGDSIQLSGKGLAPRVGDSVYLQDSVYPLLISVSDNYLRRYLNDVV